MATLGAAAGGGGGRDGNGDRDGKEKKTPTDTHATKRARISARLCDACAADVLMLGGVEMVDRQGDWSGGFGLVVSSAAGKYGWKGEPRLVRMPHGRQTYFSPYTIDRERQRMASRDPLEEMRWYKKSIMIASGLDEQEIVIALAEQWIYACRACHTAGIFGTRGCHEVDGIVEPLFAIKRALVSIYNLCICEMSFLKAWR